MANSMYFSSITQEILISDVLIIMMLTPSWDNTSNILAATPECERIPTPTSETLAKPGVRMIYVGSSWMIGMAFLTSTRGIVNEKSVRDSWLTF